VARRLLRTAERGFAVIGFVTVAFRLCFDLSVVVSPSMSPAIRGTCAEDGDWVLTEKVSHLLHRPRRWEVVAFHNPQGMQVMKRVVGLPGEAVSLQEREVAVNGVAVPRPASVGSLKYYAFGNLYGGGSVECGKGYYVLGDDSRDSEDSRFEGPLEARRIVGRAWLIVWPPSRLGFVSP
jgi:signal peptidase I